MSLNRGYERCRLDLCFEAGFGSSFKHLKYGAALVYRYPLIATCWNERHLLKREIG